MDKINNIGLARELLKVYDFDGFTPQEVWSRIAQKINIIIEHFNYLDKKFDNQKELVDSKLNYLLNEGLTEQVSKKIIALINDGTIGELINGTLLKEINDKVDNFKTEINERLDAIAYYCPQPNGLDDTETLQDILVIPNRTVLLGKGKYKISKPLNIARNVKIYGSKSTVIEVIANVDLFKVNILNEIKDLTIEQNIIGYSGNLFEISSNTIDYEGVNNVNINIENININNENTTTLRKSTNFLLFADHTKNQKGFWNVKINNITSNGNCKYFARVYKTNNSESWITGSTFSNITIDHCDYGIFEDYSTDSLSTNDYIGCAFINYDNIQFQFSISKNAFVLTSPFKQITRCVNWDWGGDIQTTPYLIVSKSTTFNSGSIYIDGDYGEITDRIRLQGQENTVENLKWFVKGYTNFYKKDSVEGEMIIYPLSLEKKETFHSLGKIKLNYQDSIVSNFSLNGCTQSQVSYINNIDISIVFYLSNNVINDVKIVSNKYTDIFGLFYYRVNDGMLYLYYKQSWSLENGGYLKTFNIGADKRRNTTLVISPMQVEQPSNLTQITNYGYEFISEKKSFEYKITDMIGGVGYDKINDCINLRRSDDWYHIKTNHYGTSVKRPTQKLYIGFEYYDTTLNKPIYWNGTNWYDSNGSLV